MAWLFREVIALVLKRRNGNGNGESKKAAPQVVVQSGNNGHCNFGGLAESLLTKQLEKSDAMLAEMIGIRSDMKDKWQRGASMGDLVAGELKREKA